MDNDSNQNFELKLNENVQMKNNFFNRNKKYIIILSSVFSIIFLCSFTFLLGSFLNNMSSGSLKDSTGTGVSSSSSSLPSDNGNAEQNNSDQTQNSNENNQNNNSNNSSNNNNASNSNDANTSSTANTANNSSAQSASGQAASNVPATNSASQAAVPQSNVPSINTADIEAKINSFTARYNDLKSKVNMSNFFQYRAAIKQLDNEIDWYEDSIKPLAFSNPQLYYQYKQRLDYLDKLVDALDDLFDFD